MSDTIAGYRPDRLRRAWLLVKSGRVERLGGTHYRVAGNVESSYYVDLMGDQPCTCLDQEYRGTAIQGMCKHLLAARLASLDPALLQVIAEMIEREQALAKEQAATRRTARQAARRQTQEAR